MTRISEISVEELAGRLERGEPTFLVDVRQPWENELARLPGGLLAPLAELTEYVDDVDVDSDTLVVVYCHHGIRSLSGTAILLRQGFPQVVSLAGGIDAWSKRIDPSIPLY